MAARLYKISKPSETPRVNSPQPYPTLASRLWAVRAKLIFTPVTSSTLGVPSLEMLVTTLPVQLPCGDHDSTSNKVLDQFC